jgi:hypothetical protein
MFSWRRTASQDFSIPITPYEVAPYQSDSMANIPEIETPGITNYHITAVNTVITPNSYQPSPTSPTVYNKDSKPENVLLNRPNQFRAFGRRAIAYQKRQWFNNVCCVV